MNYKPGLKLEEQRKILGVDLNVYANLSGYQKLSLVREKISLFYYIFVCGNYLCEEQP